MRFTPFAALASAGLSVQYLIVGGGAPGEASNATDYGGYGGGAGGYLTGSTTINFGTSYPIVVGLGGFAGLADLTLQSSSFNGLAAGGGNGAKTGPPQAYGLANTILCSGKTVKSGGGGASGAGTDPSCVGSDGQAGNGGNGLTWFDGNTYAGGGGGGTLAGSIGFAGTGGTGGGGRGAYAAVSPEAGTANTGGGGGGGGYTTVGGNGGSGIVKIRYAGGPVLQGGIITQSGGYTYHSFITGSTLFT